MPERPWQHQLETESRNAFRSLLPPAWVFRDYSPDYGIDGQVEIFDSDGNRTGESFLVQLKATASDSWKVRLSVSELRYFRSSDLPVLIALYRAESGEFYGRWAQTIDPYYARGAESLAVHFTEENRLLASRIREDLQVIRMLKHPARQPAVAFALRIKADDSEELLGESSLAIRSAVRAAFSQAPGIELLDEEPSHLCPLISLSEDELQVDLVGISSATVHLNQDYRTDDLLTKLPYDVLLLTGLALDRHGRLSLAAHMVVAALDGSTLLSTSRIARAALSCLIRAGQLERAMVLADEICTHHGFTEQTLTMALVTLHGSRLPSDQQTALEEFLRRRVDRARTLGDRGLIATSEYNLAKHYHRRDPRLAVKAYLRAVRADDAYMNRDYFVRDLAGALFQSGRYRLAAKLYETLLNTPLASESRPLLADAKLHSGRYLEAEELYVRHITDEERPDAEWVLKAKVLPDIRLVGGESQPRDRPGARRHAAPNLEGYVEARSELERALELDALCCLAWFNLGVVENKAGNREEALDAFLISALVCRWDREAWVNALGLVLGLGPGELAGLIVQAGFVAHGESFIQGAYALFQCQPPNFPTAEAMRFVSSVIESKEVRPNADSVTLRLLHEEGGWDSLVLDTSSGSVKRTRRELPVSSES